MSDVPISFNVETNVGGVSVTICTCGGFILPTLFHEHAKQCASYQNYIKEKADGEADGNKS